MPGGTRAARHVIWGERMKVHGQRGVLRTEQDPGMMNAHIELDVRAHAFLSPFFPQRGLLMLGEAGVEFRQRGGRGYVQVPWKTIDTVRVDVYGSFVRSVELFLVDGRALSFVVDRGVDVVRAMSHHLERAQLVSARRTKRM